MIGNSELNQLNMISSQYNNFKTLLSGSAAPNFSNFSSDVTPDINVIKNDFGKLLNPDTSSLNVDQLIDAVISGFASSMSGMGSFNVSINDSKVNGDKGGGGIISQLIGLVKGVIMLPVRFGYLFKSLMEGTGSLALGVGGLSQSFALGTKDIYLLIIAILNIFFKYFLCVVSFVITTIGGCFFFHVITFFVVMIYLFVMYLADIIHDKTGIDLSSSIDQVAEHVSWPDIVNVFCYSCFGIPVKLRDILVDVGVLQDIGNIISYDFNNTMPRYMKPAIPLGTDALDSLDKATN